MPVRHLIWGSVSVLVQWLVLGRLQLWGAYPDLVLLFIAWIAFQYGRRTGALTGFALGFVMDMIYGTWGIQMFVKTLVGFIVGLFPADERDTLIIRPQQAFLLGTVIALMHNGLFMTLLLLQTGSRNPAMILSLWLGSAVYTGVVANLLVRFSARSY